jgi:hypothetical protein
LLVGDAVGADPIFGEGISMALGYGAIAAQEISESFRRGEFSFGGYKRRLARSGLGQTLFARWVITQGHLFLQMEMVPDPALAFNETDRPACGLGLCFELEQTASENYDFTRLMKPGVFNSRSSR